jgi:hypothetical protein
MSESPLTLRVCGVEFTALGHGPMALYLNIVMKDGFHIKGNQTSRNLCHGVN